jgi:NAD+ kinase
MKIKSILVVYYVHNYSALREVERSLKKAKIHYKAVKRENLRASNFKARDLVITVGGDGTFLKVAKFARNIPVFSVSSEPRYNEGFFARADITDYDEKLGLLLKGRCKIVKLPLLEATFSGCRDKLVAINEIFVGSSQPQHTSRYIIEIGNRNEFQKSSGIIISTPAGSHAWAKSAGAKPMPINSKKFLYTIREPYIGRLTQSKLLGGTLKENQAVKIISQIHNGIAVADSSNKAHKFVDGDVIEIRKSKETLNMVDF